ncbi:IclR family transcriptional regulator [Microbacterium marinilacus]|uniref:IclR family transcriptional regulator n=1 Tax=Microbacterium marinilacus TaxID=415209 RepID=A0ABP7BGT6_9MICO|nr:IclR family transcriptional regulator [Microbacterium marinilacus]MBY0690342.1 IclR family transcriptional regulator [Microbacterium marinilacus]
MGTAAPEAGHAGADEPSADGASAEETSTDETRAGAKRTAAARMLALLEAFSRGGGALTLSEISRYADLSLTTAHRLVHEILDWGGLDIDDAGRYRLSRKFLDLASTSTQALRLRETALPHLIDLHRMTGLTVHLTTRDGGEVVYLEALRGHPNYTGENRMGGRLALHVTATGLAMLAFAPDEVLERYLAAPHRAFTSRTPVTAADIRARVEEIRRRRYAIAEGCLADGAGSVAVPLTGEDGRIEHAVGIVYRLGQAEPRRLVTLARATADRITAALVHGTASPDPRTIAYNRRKAGLA